MMESVLEMGGEGRAVCVCILNEGAPLSEKLESAMFKWLAKFDQRPGM